MRHNTQDSHTRGLRVAALLLALALAVTAPALADVNRPTGETVIANVDVTPSVVIFKPIVETEGMTLTVAGDDGCLIERTFKAGETPYFEPFDEKGEPLPDCTFTFELRAVPVISAEVKAMLKKNRNPGGNPTLGKELRKAGLLPAQPLVQVGYFTTLDGRFTDPGAVEDRAAKAQKQAAPLVGGQSNLELNASASRLENVSGFDFVINDDLIVDGSACIGFDCVNGESFGFDTIRVKENNLRIKFDDTSTAASFPRNDWQLTANDSANGGASKFSIDDISNARTPFTVEANARSHSLYVDDGGRIGNRTSTPSVEIHTIDGDTPTLRLQQDGSSGFAPQTWDVAGNETNFFVRDVTNGSALPFRIRPGAPSSSIFIDVDGSVGIGTSSPDEAVHILRTSSDADARLLIENSTATVHNNNEMFTMRNAGSVQFSMTDFQTGSDVTWQLNASANFFRLRKSGNATGDEFKLAENGDLEITGGLVTGTVGSCTSGSPCDGVFEPWFERPDIEEHAAQMWANKHLPAVGPTLPDQPVNLTKKTLGMLNELEMAHIYIEEMNQKLQARDAQVADLQERLERLEQLLATSLSK